MLDALGIFQRKVADQCLQESSGLDRKRWHLGDTGQLGEALQPANFDNDAGTDQAELAEMLTQGFGLAGITAIDGGECGKGGKGGKGQGSGLHVRLSVR